MRRNDCPNEMAEVLSNNENWHGGGMLSRIIENGNFKRWVRISLAILGMMLILAGQRWGSYGISVPGMAVGAVGMFSSKAFMKNIKSLGDRDLRIKK